jgi:hypothetical protein
LTATVLARLPHRTVNAKDRDGRESTFEGSRWRDDKYPAHKSAASGFADGSKKNRPLSIWRFADRLEGVATESKLRSEVAMRFLCLVYHEEEKLAALSQRQMDTLVGACIGWAEELEKSGHHILSAGLQSVRSAATVRVRNDKLSTTDGPFAETKEVLGGFTLIDAKDFDEALQIAAKFPAAQIGSMEVRPVLEPGEKVADPLDQRIQASILQNASGFNPFAASKMASLPRPDTTEER